MRSLLFLFLAACGPTPFLQPVQTGALVQGPGAPVDCVAICERAKPQLIRDFAVPPAQVDCLAPDFTAADDCGACQNAFRTKYGVELTQCP